MSVKVVRNGLITMPSKISLNIDPELKNWLEQEASRRHSSADALAGVAIERLRDATERRREIIADALAEADKGEFISQARMTEWLVSLDDDENQPSPQADVVPTRA